MRHPRPVPDTENDVFGPRAVAAAIDAVIVALMGWFLAGMTAVIAPGLVTAGGAIAVAFAVAYFVYAESTRGQTFGKRAMGLVVVDEDGRRLTVVAATIRNVLRLVDLLPAFYVVGIVAILLTGRSQRLGDLGAETVVVRADG